MQFLENIAFGDLAYPCIVRGFSFRLESSDSYVFLVEIQSEYLGVGGKFVFQESYRVIFQFGVLVQEFPWQYGKDE
jgi:hypothetical protein